MLIVLDEAPMILGTEGTLIYNELEELVRVEAHRGIYMIFASQDIEGFRSAPFVFKQSQYILFPHNFGLDDFKKLLENIKQYDFHAAWKRDVTAILRLVKETSEGRMWVCLDVNEAKGYVFYALASLSKHAETKN